MKRTLLIFVLLAGPLAHAQEDPPADEAPGEAPAAEEPAPPPADEAAEAPTGMDEALAPVTGKTATDEGIDLTLKDRIKAVARKSFLKAGRFELSPSMAATVNDSFFRTWGVSGRAAWHVNDSLALELGGVWVPPGFTEKLPPVDLLSNASLLVPIDNALVGIVDAGITFSPLYGKMAVLGDAIIHFDGFVSAGGGVAFDISEQIWHPALDVGVGARVFLTRWLVLRADVRDYLYPQDKNAISTLQNLLFVNVGVGFYLPLDFDYHYEAARVNSNG